MIQMGQMKQTKLMTFMFDNTKVYLRGKTIFILNKDRKSGIGGKHLLSQQARAESTILKGC